MPSRLGFLTLRCWLDADGRHIWQRHDCVDGPSESMLPDTWRVIGTNYPKDVHPSIICTACGLHAFGTVETRPQEAPNA